MKRVLVTGARGFLGRHCLPRLGALGYQVHAVSRVPAPSLHSDVQWHDADLLDGGSVSRLIERVAPTHLLHLAWYTAHGEFWASPENIRWVEATLSLARHFSRLGTRLVMAGSCAEYDWRYGVCSEATPLVPATLYGASKHAAHIVLERYAPMVNLSYASGRLFLLYGPDEPPQRLVPSVARALISGTPARCGHGQQVRDVLHVRDAADALVTLLDSRVEGPVNIASGAPIKLADLIYRLANIAGRPDLIELGVLPPRDEPLELTADVSRLTRELGWTPKFDLEAGLTEMLEWWTRRIAQERAAIL